MLSTKYITSLDRITEKGVYDDGAAKDVDLQVKVLQVFKIDNFQSEMRVIDSSEEIWHCQINHAKFRWLHEGQYVRVRNASLTHHLKGYKNTFGLRKHSNILSLPYPCKLAQEMYFDEVNAVREFERESLTSNETLMHPIVISTIENDDQKFKPLTPLKTLVQENLEEPQRVRFSVMGTQKDSSFVKVLNTKTGEISEATAKTAIGK